jgi:hypothetical protein
MEKQMYKNKIPIQVPNKVLYQFLAGPGSFIPLAKKNHPTIQ